MPSTPPTPAALRIGAMLLLSDLCPGDRDVLARAWTDPDLTANLSHQARTPQDCAALLDRAQRDAQHRPRRFYRLAMVHRDDQAMSGTIALDVRQHSSAFAHSGSILPEYQGRGAGTEMLNLACGMAFDGLGPHRVEFECKPTTPW